MRNTPFIEINRHCQTLSEKETDEFVGAVADFIVAFVKRQGNGQPEAAGNLDKSPNKTRRAGGMA